MIELEAPESEILNCKTCFVMDDKDYVIKYDNFLKYTRETEDDVECVIPYIRQERVVAVRKFKQRDSCWQCTTVYANDDLNPAWTHEIFSDSSYPGEYIDGKFVQYIESEEISKYYDYYCMSGAPKYYTLSEVDNCCDGKTRNDIFRRVRSKGVVKEDWKTVTVAELL